MSETKLRRAGRAILSLHRTGLLVPAAGLAVMGVSAYAMVAVAQAFPETAFAPDGIGQCNPFEGDFGCGHGFGCACHMLPKPDPLV
ncbi:hypothetical protein [Roseinatronobacter bogoriensis]|nr:hypothetical protein [Rhodobaca]MBB4209886.1 hypothetical protein [Rhodobaca bogoriensis DSM 18756]TDW33018.1 hypothetical protein LY39_03669 [Rhodobaca barguzinensis]TDY65855.1 hypothetical protein EV660_1169 [Rhodobaca bogoriensis DSM 18756]